FLAGAGGMCWKFRSVVNQVFWMRHFLTGASGMWWNGAIVGAATGRSARSLMSAVSAATGPMGMRQR
ncbi:MAG: hypothetical protein M3354_01990, partial [Chloroflexota bacterium]|nr:hypothetical protein [Chloroflexota bacterium]